MATLLHIIWPPFNFSTPNLAPFPTWSTTSTNLLTGTRKSPSASKDQIKCSALPLLTGTGAYKMTPLHVGTSYTHDFQFHSKENASATHQRAWAGSKNAKFVGMRTGFCLTCHAGTMATYNTTTSLDQDPRFQKFLN